VASDYNTYEDLVLKYGPDGTLLKRYALSGGGGFFAISYDRKHGRVYVLSYEDVRCYDRELNLVSSQAVGDELPGRWIYYEGGLDVDADGNVYLGGGYWGAYPDQSSYYIGHKYAPELSSLLWISTDTVPGNLDYPYAMAAMPDGGMCVVTAGDDPHEDDYGAGIGCFASSGEPVGKRFYAGVPWLTGIAADESGNIYLPTTTRDFDAARLLKIGRGAGEIAWSVTYPEAWFFWQALADEPGRIYVIGEWNAPVGDEYFFIARYLQAAGADTTPPAAVADLAVAGVSSGTVTLAWTAPGDDGSDGTAAAYDLRYTTAGAITADDAFNAAARAQGVPAPQIAGAAETFTIIGLMPGTTYFFAIKTADAAGNVSGLSNSLIAVTSAAPTACVEVIGVPNWKQFNDGTNTWWDDDYDHTTRKISALGCLLTAAAQVVKKHGYDTDPGKLNTTLIGTSGGFDGSGVDLKVLATKVTAQGISLGYEKITGTEVKKKTALEESLNSGNPVILHLYSASKVLGSHFVVATKKCGDKVYINDPGNNNARVATLDQYFGLITNGNPKTIRSVRKIIKN
jgi:hypothetical protein